MMPPKPPKTPPDMPNAGNNTNPTQMSSPVPGAMTSPMPGAMPGQMPGWNPGWNPMMPNQMPANTMPVPGMWTNPMPGMWSNPLPGMWANPLPGMWANPMPMMMPPSPAMMGGMGMLGGIGGIGMSGGTAMPVPMPMPMPMMPATPAYREFLELPYELMEEMNLKVKAERLAQLDASEVCEGRMRYLMDEKRIKAVTVCFTDLEGRFHMLDYDKKYLLKSWNNLTFDGSSVRGFTDQSESDLRLGLDWTAFYWLPCDVFGPGKVLVFGEVMERDGGPFPCDMRSQLKQYLKQLRNKDQMTLHGAPEIEGFLFNGRDAERCFPMTRYFEPVSTGGYYHSLPGDALRRFIDRAAEAQRAMGFENEKDHPEVAPSQFEMNFGHTDALIAADQIQLYKLLCRQVAAQCGMTASFLPKPMTGVNGNGMHLNLSISRNGRNLFHEKHGQDGLASMGWDFIDRILTNANDLCLALNSSVNAYRRLDPHFEAPNQIKASPIDRGAMIRIPLCNETSARIEVRSVAPDANPYLAFYTLARTGLEGPRSGQDHGKPGRNECLPDNILDAIDCFGQSPLITRILGEEVQKKYTALKCASADRCSRSLGGQIKVPEIQFHHEVTNQFLWSQF